MFKSRTYQRNEKLAAWLGLPYSPAAHAVYKDALRAMHRPVKSVASVLLHDAYDRKLVGFSAKPLATRPKTDTPPPELIEEAESSTRFAELKTEVCVYTYALARATGAEITAEVKAQALGINLHEDGILSDAWGAYARGELHCGDKSFFPCWFNPKGFGWGGLNKGGLK